MSEALISVERKKFHKALIANETLTASPFRKFGFTWISSNADSGQKLSVSIANDLALRISQSAGVNLVQRDKKKEGQTLGNEFENQCSEFIRRTFLGLGHLRPGNWVIERVGSRVDGLIGRYAQYSHLAELGRLAKENKELRSCLGEGYTIAPDVVVARIPENDEIINDVCPIVDDFSCGQAVLRSANHDNPDNPLEIIHASVSCKFTMRTDRAQNTRTEALNLIRNRKGRLPHVVSVTAEPVPSRLASLALGTGDLDCVYHFALYELMKTLDDLNKDDAVDLLNTMIEGKRLKDISDLPLDLAV